jgi:phage shock protein PspC (stress-responsive transcriptional regulator)
MKKNININISGIIFYIEEDGYDQLKEYLVSIHRYFSTYEDSAEIIADIENRIAEIFLAKLGENKQVITQDDIGELVATMGSVADFQALEDENFAKNTTSQQDQKASQSTYTENKTYSNSGSYTNTEKEYSSSASGINLNKTSTEPKKLLRDNKRKLIGGVASGIAHYVGVDPLWVRLMFLATMFDWLYIVSVSGVAFVSYCLMWALVPASNDLEEDSKIKKLFRNPDNKVLGGVAGGLAAYFGVDVNVIRVLLVLGVALGGSTFIGYLILWAITPEAKTLTEKMQMEGEPITLGNIEKKIKENLNIDDNQDENVLTKILLFPFRLISQLFAAITPFVSPLGNFAWQVVLIILGVKFILLGLALVGSFTVAYLGLSGGLFGLEDEVIKFNGLPVATVAEFIPSMGLLSAYITVLIPSISLVISGISVIAKRKIMSNTLAWSLFGVWVVSLITTTAMAAEVAKKFAKKDSIEVIENLDLQGEVITIDSKTVLNADGKNIRKDFEETKLTIKGYDGDKVQLVKHFEGRGTTKEEARNNAQGINYKVEMVGKDKVILDNHFELKDGANFRMQELRTELFVPYGQKFKMGKYLVNISYYTVTPHGYDVGDIKDENTWVFDKKDGLKCLTCEKKPENDDRQSFEGSKQFDFKDFNSLEIRNNIDVEVYQSDSYEVAVDVEDEDLAKEVAFKQEGSKLIVYFSKRSSDAKIRIKMPTLKALQADGSCDIKVFGFNEKEIKLDLSGNIDFEGHLKVENLKGNFEGKCEVQLIGDAQKADIYLGGACELSAEDFVVQEGKINAEGASEADVFFAQKLEAHAKGASEINYKGGATLTGTGDVQKIED